MAHLPVRGASSVRWLLLPAAIVVAGLPVLLAGCNSHPLAQPRPDNVLQTDRRVSINPSRELDLLFVIDNSLSMEQEQHNLGLNFPRMIEELEKLPGGLPDVHIAVVSSDMGAGPYALGGGCDRVLGDHGIFRVEDECNLNPGARWIEAFDNGSRRNFTGELGSVFGCLAKLGKQGCGYEHQLQSLRVALSDINAENQGFLRKDAYLGVIIISDEDDCSAPPATDLFDDSRDGEAASFRCAYEGHLCDGKSPPRADFTASLAACAAREDGKLIPVREVIEFVRGLKARPDEQIVVAGIIGWPLQGEAPYRYGHDGATGGQDYLPTCDAPGSGQAWAGLRLKKFIDAFGQGNVFSICGADFRAAMTRIGQALTHIIDPACVTAQPVDTDSDTPGLQADCKVFFQAPGADGSRSRETQLPACTAAATRPCWTLVEDAERCSAQGSPYRIAIDHGDTSPPVGTLLSLKCLTCTGHDLRRCP